MAEKVRGLKESIRSTLEIGQLSMFGRTPQHSLPPQGAPSPLPTNKPTNKPTNPQIPHIPQTRQPLNGNASAIGRLRRSIAGVHSGTGPSHLGERTGTGIIISCSSHSLPTEKHF